ncbi:prolipoprotein diacylglyceryl transferase [Actinomadura graeca]|uniref:Phosphatidylglycerol--prolipoprotein diacylglyceryl transferase n=1 Tax=Actinomadura graeca TaxID=2750812 RepID=A0ABX8R2X3_9ACTN|nr:prolipoprotein diacylglyceryl transferase [Actinomadura graeca]QXJ25450.1 prolipoprotein diacylglyceryl transferase [Actinomadura graeca]
MQPLASIPSPSQGVWHLGPLPIRAYAIMIILGIVVAVWLGERRWAAKGGTPGVIVDVAVWAVPFGLVGGRLYHVITDYQRYFGDDGDPVRALKIWEGGLGIWGAVLLGAVGAVIGCRRRGISVLALGDAVAPGIALGQAIGRWGNYWNQELYGRPLDAFWALEIDRDQRPRLSGDGLAPLDPKYADVATYHPAFLYESLWCVGVTILVIWADRRYGLTHGRAFALYVAAYTVGRFWIEALRIDDAHHFLGMRLNDWTSIVVFLGAVAYLYLARGKTGVENVGQVPADGPSGTAAGPEPEKAEKDQDDEGGQEGEEAGKDEAEQEPFEKPDPDETETERPEAQQAGAGAGEPEATEPEPKAALPEPEPEPESAQPEPGGPGESETGAAVGTEDEDAAPEGTAGSRTGDDEGDDAPGASGGAGKGEPVKDGK